MDWENLEPDKYNLVKKHFTKGRGGRKIRHVTLHHMAMIGDVDKCVAVWRDRPASAHYCIDQYGKIGQAVNDWDTAWSNANLRSNQESITIEHSNSGYADKDWPISEATREAGAHLVAAICRYYKLGRPVSGKNVRFHSIESGGSTGCPWHLRPGHKYHDSYIVRAQWWYDRMGKKAAPKPVPKSVPKPQPKGGSMTDFDQINRRYKSRVPGSKVTMTPRDALYNTDAHAYLILQKLEKMQAQLDRLTEGK